MGNEEIYLALMHHPVYDRQRNIVTSSVTNIDVHDIARSCRTYGIARFYVVTPVDALRALVRRIIKHWEVGAGREYNPSRHDALSIVSLERSLEGVEIDIERATGRLPDLIGTTARRRPDSASYEEVRSLIETKPRPRLILLGTGWGLTDETLDRCTTVLEPLNGPTDYNHLSVRGAGAIILDRLRGTR